MRTRDRLSQKGLLPRMEARPKKSGFAYRYHPVNGKPIALGDDREAAIRRVLDLIGKADDNGTIDHCWRLYKESEEWRALAELTRVDYETCSKPLLKVFGSMRASSVTQQMCRHYMKVERKGIVRANREMALMSNLLGVAVDFGYAALNVTRGMKRLKERPRTIVPVADSISSLTAWLVGRGKQWAVIAAMAQFAAKTGARRTEFLEATVFQVRDGEARLGRAKQREGVQVTDVIELDEEALQILASVKREGSEYLFTTRRKKPTPYTPSGFKAMWAKAMKQALKEGVITQRFTFHDLRAYYASKHAEQEKSLPALHKNPQTTARVYDRRVEVRRKAV